MKGYIHHLHKFYLLGMLKVQFEIRQVVLGKIFKSLQLFSL